MPAKLISSEELQYPSNAERKGLEAWIYFSYTIGTDGRVSSVEILDSNGIALLNRALIEHIKSRVYEPALLNGEPVEEIKKAARTTFVVTGKPREADRIFYSRYKKARAALREGELDEGKALLDKLAATENRNLYEELYLQTLMTAYYEVTNQDDQAYVHALRVLEFHTDEDDEYKIADDDYFIPFLVSIYQYEVNNMRLGDALLSAEWLQEIDPAHDSVKAVSAHASTLTAHVIGKQHAMELSLVTPVYGGTRGTTFIHLLKNEIEIEQLAGTLDSLILHCDHGTKRLDYGSESAWIIPQSWTPCWLWVAGEVGTRLRLTELPGGTLEPGKP
ncbi:MAG: energy transducer TonB [Pseudomonadota bacterium]